LYRAISFEIVSSRVFGRSLAAPAIDSSPNHAKQLGFGSDEKWTQKCKVLIMNWVIIVLPKSICNCDVLCCTIVFRNPKMRAEKIPAVFGIRIFSKRGRVKRNLRTFLVKHSS